MAATGFTRTVVRTGCRTRVAWLALRPGREVTWSARGAGLECLRLDGNVVRLTTGRTLNLRSTSTEPRLFLPNDAGVAPTMRLDGWLRIDPAG